MATYDDYHYHLYSTSPAHSVYLPKDVFWSNELTWSKVSQTIEWGTTGALLIQEGVKLAGREIDLSGKDNMAWVTREVGLALQTMRDLPGLAMHLSFQMIETPFTELFNIPVIFRHADGALDMTPVLDFDQYEPGAWYIIRGIKLLGV